MYNEMAKASIYKWRELHKEKHAQYHNERQKIYNEKHREAILAKKREMYQFRKFINNSDYDKECILLRAIFL
jgi:hypothetical protein